MKKVTSKNDELEINFGDIVKKINVALVLLIIILIIGLYLRLYHIQYPVVGYHNWKSAHYITEARNFAREGFFKEGFFVPMRDTQVAINEPASGMHPDTFPVIPIITGFLFKIFGEDIVIARLVGIIFTLGSIIIFYLLVKDLFNREDLALLSAFLVSINPMLVFFTHNIQLVHAGLFFMLLGAWLYIKWVKDLKKTMFLYFATFFIMLAIITKYPFGIIVFPILFTFPYSKVLSKPLQYAKTLAISTLISLGFPLWYLYTKTLEKRYGLGLDQSALQQLGLSSLIDLGIIWDKNFWMIIRSYVADNFTLIGMSLMMLGSIAFFCIIVLKNPNEKFKKTLLLLNLLPLILYLFLAGLSFVNIQLMSPLLLSYLFLSYITLTTALLFVIFTVKTYSEKKPFEVSIGNKFILGYFVGLVLFTVIMGFKLSGHNYHQYPIAPLIIFLIAYLITLITNSMLKLIPMKSNKEIIGFVAILILLFAVPGPANSLINKSMESTYRMFDTQFPGLDIAGYYIRDHSMPNERIYHSSGQNYGVLWHAERKGYKPPKNVEEFILAEAEYNVSWVFMYQGGIQAYFERPDIMDHIRNNYKLVQFGFFQVSQGIQPMYYLFQKGGTFNESQLNTMLQNKPIYETTYYYSKDRPYKMTYINLE